MFRECVLFNQPLNSWNVSNVTDMSEMFKDCKSFNQPLDGWNVSNVTNMRGMFEDCKSFNQPLNGWNVNKDRVNVIKMFVNCVKLDQPLNYFWELTIYDFIEFYMFVGATHMEQKIQELEEAPEREQKQQKRNQELEKQKEINERNKMFAEDEEQQHARRRAENPDIDSFEDCAICGDPLNDVDGPGDQSEDVDSSGNSNKCTENCNDCIIVCKNGHIFHRGCILGWCNAGQVDFIEQMNFPDDYTHYRPQGKTSKCPLCTVDINCSGFKTKPKVSVDELREYKIRMSRGGKKIRKTRKNKKSGNKKSKKIRKSKKTIKLRKHKTKKSKK